MKGLVLVLFSDHEGRRRADPLVREAASREFGVPEHAMRVVRLCPSCGSSAHGRPQLAPVPGLRVPDVSISHTGEVTLVALSSAGAVGVDVERSEAAAFAGLAAVALHPAEEAGSVRDLTTTWVRKEALLKATGRGLAVDPARIRLAGPGEPPALLEWPLAGPRPPVQMYDVETVPGHVAAVAVLGRDPARLVVRRAAPAARSPRATR